MWIAVLSGLLVSIDALFIGISFGSQKKCKFWHLLIINTVLIGLCFLGYGLGIWIGDRIDIELDVVIGILFILLGSATIVYYLAFERRHAKKIVENESVYNNTVFDSKYSSSVISSVKKTLPTKSIIITGILMSVEAMFITVGLTLVLNTTTILIPLTVGFAHLIYCSVTFFFAKYLRRLPPVIGPVIAGTALIIYGIMAFFL
ncbi:MAG: hypothetical protein FWE03_06505 [Firmicutes bacterium]|nr:hypothetical protein [Bacillota bacterium]